MNRKIIGGLALFLSAYILPASKTFAQKEANWWHFGTKASINFNSGNPVAVTGSALDSEEASASISDPSSGALLFYTDGIKVYKPSNTIMPNASGTSYNLGGNSSTSQTLIIPNPANNQQYYIFSVGQQGSTGMKYSVVDLSLNKLTAVNLTMPNSSDDCEQMTAIKRCNGDYWVIAHEYKSNKFKAYPISANVIGAPVISATGAARTTVEMTRGTMKASANGKLIATSIIDVGVELFDFNSLTGKISLKKLVDHPTKVNQVSIGTFYGVEFSPLGKYLYYTISPRSGFYGVGVYQYNILSQTKTTIAQSGGVGGIQIAPDGNIYIARLLPYHLARLINVDGAVTYIENAVTFTSGQGSNYLGLPNFSNFSKETDCPKAEYIFSNLNVGKTTAQEGSKYGNQEVTTVCLPNVFIDGSASSNEDRYYLSIWEFDLQNWLFVGTPLYDGWYCLPSGGVPCQVPPILNLSNIVHTPFHPGTVYIVSLSVGPVWDSKTRFLRVKDCSIQPPRGNGLPDLSGIGITKYLNISPNPTVDILNLEKVTPDDINNIQVDLIDLTGTVIRTTTISDNEVKSLDLNGLNPGIYSLRYTIDGVLKYQTVLKQ